MTVQTFDVHVVKLYSVRTSVINRLFFLKLFKLSKTQFERVHRYSAILCLLYEKTVLSLHKNRAGLSNAFHDNRDTHEIIMNNVRLSILLMAEKINKPLYLI